METFATTRDAKEFLIGQIVGEAQREGVPLSELERRMLYYSETDWTLAEMQATSDAFDETCDREEYEQKIGKLIRDLQARARKESSTERKAWKAAVRSLRGEDHYLLVLIGVANGSLSPGEEKPSHLSASRLLKLAGIGFVIFAALVLIAVGYVLLTR